MVILHTVSVMDSEVHLVKFLLSSLLWMSLSSLSPPWKFPLALLHAELLTAWISQQGSVVRWTFPSRLCPAHIINELGEDEGHRLAGFAESQIRIQSGAC